MLLLRATELASNAGSGCSALLVLLEESAFSNSSLWLNVSLRYSFSRSASDTLRNTSTYSCFTWGCGGIADPGAPVPLISSKGGMLSLTGNKFISAATAILRDEDRTNWIFAKRRNEDSYVHGMSKWNHCETKKGSRSVRNERVNQLIAV